MHAVIGQLQLALSACNEALRLRPNDPSSLDTRGFTYLKMGDLDNAIADSNAALLIDPNKASSLYARGRARLLKGDNEGNADVSAAKAIKSSIAEDFRRFGLK